MNTASTHIDRFYPSFRGRSPDDVLAYLAKRTGPVASRLTVVFRSLRPEAPIAALGAFLHQQMSKSPSLDDKAVQDLYDKYSEKNYSLADRAYLARIHPLELWMGAYLQKHTGASLSDIVQASASARQDSYSWLFKTHSARKQDVQIRVIPASGSNAREPLVLERDLCRREGKKCPAFAVLF